MEEAVIGLDQVKKEASRAGALGLNALGGGGGGRQIQGARSADQYNQVRRSDGLKGGWLADGGGGIHNDDIAARAERNTKDAGGISGALLRVPVVQGNRLASVLPGGGHEHRAGGLANATFAVHESYASCHKV